MPDDVGALHAARIEDAHHVAGDVEDAVALDPCRFRRLAEPAQIGCDHAVSGIDERRYLMSPQRVRIGEAVQQQDGRAVAFVLHRKRQISERNGLHDWSFLTRRRG